ncbi:MAG: hypothetical protein JWP78_600 [Mucilaginibacter sp.]|nr:hypothetical protein [Mucilaginibacter sp.]
MPGVTPSPFVNFLKFTNSCLFFNRGSFPLKATKGILNSKMKALIS